MSDKNDNGLVEIQQNRKPEDGIAENDFLTEHWNDLSGASLFNILKTTVKHAYLIASKVAGMSQVLQQMQLDHLKNNITTLQRDVKMIDVRTEQIRTEGEELNKDSEELSRKFDTFSIEMDKKIADLIKKSETSQHKVVEALGTYVDSLAKELEMKADREEIELMR
ncbi:hypothetical protein GUITHDRAFT_147363 [Guillardia theta CCMP2712]|uniref:Uncharacterized protein n=1 Tax=Guillardia theta (strain CCMP2712) TaxID=905079 RepID=L1IDC6_GUITC|nr:hypothetical protein GUITHDRAFT_147363 [Guillardia theta CCMP2712]EKX34243.1 hypothetical protein GUITHDRAFT_147363 [Guillardia theta CCMP2712]|eukprot:XP_005821223.1 hypothetical protein GUITHDRAFT_147363 [Guillardia theta CCMP2712]